MYAMTWSRTLALLLAASGWFPITAAAQGLEYKETILRFSDLPGIDEIRVRSRFYGFQSAVDRDLTAGEAAYDYSVHIIRDTETGQYRMYSGGRWRSETPPVGDGDHVLQHVSDDGAAGTWFMPHDRPEFPQGQEEGYPDTWFANNYLEPEVLKVGGTYYMYTQLQVNPGMPIDIPGQVAATGADRIQLHTSEDGSNWTRWSTTRGVVVNMDQPTKTSLHHQEVIYVPWDADGRPYWMYVAFNLDNVFNPYARIRSADPTTFDWQQREPGLPLAQLGNQIGYAVDAPEGPLFVRIFFTESPTGRQVPSLQFSRDGLAWTTGTNGPVPMDGSKDNANNRNCYFLGLSTLDGTGALEKTGGRQYRALYGATTANTPVAPEIFYAEIGVGELLIDINPNDPPEPTHHSADTDEDYAIGLSELLRVVQLHTSGTLHCDAAEEDGYAPDPGEVACGPHDSDYAPNDWRISLPELLRTVQLYRAGAYHNCTEGDDGFCLGTV